LPPEVAAGCCGVSLKFPASGADAGPVEQVLLVAAGWLVASLLMAALVAALCRGGHREDRAPRHRARLH